MLTVKPNHPLAEILAQKLCGIEVVPLKEQTKMVRAAIKVAVEWVENLESRNKILAEALWELTENKEK